MLYAFNYKKNLKSCIMEKYKFLDILGKGTHGIAFLFENPQKKLMVIKSIQKKNQKYANREIDILKKIKHSRIIELYDVINQKQKTCIILEYANYGSLETFIKKMKFDNSEINMKTAWSIFSQMVDGISFLHKKFIIHRDIKPGNILLIEKTMDSESYLNVKICDFGLSIRSNTICPPSIVGTIWYMAPEILNKEEYDNTIDIWSLRITIYELISLSKPFSDITRVEYKYSITNKLIRIIPNCKDPCLKLIILKCLKKVNRITSHELREDNRIKYYIRNINEKDRVYKLYILKEKLNNIASNTFSCRL